jgi:UDP-N-acetylmuramoyl-tripeptide--D-alanyl-D-alanine ligase
LKAISANEIAREVGGTLIKGGGTEVATAVSTDSRTAKSGDVFFALKGENHDAHDHLDKLSSGSCEVIIVSDESKVPEDFYGSAVKVSDTIEALSTLAHYYRNLVNPKVVGITGSVGKTLLKDMTALVLSKVYNVHSTKGNFNNNIGLPLTILSMPENTELLVVEMGMNHKGEISELVKIANPDVAAIVNVGVAHRENFDSEDGIYNAKLEITELFDEDNILVINGDDERLFGLKVSRDAGELGYDVVSVVTDANEDSNWDYIVKNTHHISGGGLEFDIEDAYESEGFTLPPNGMFASLSAGLSVAIGGIFDVTMKDAAEALKNLSLAPHRLKSIENTEADITIIDDTYNANPDSMKGGISYLLSAEGGRKIAILADMNELGEFGPTLHEGVGSFAAEEGVDALFTFGEKAKDIAAGAKKANTGIPIKMFESKDELISFAKGFVREGDVILVKGSRGLKMEEVVEGLLC